MKPPFIRVTSAMPCPVCNRSGWCRFSKDGASAICNRIPSARPAEDRGGGWVHPLSAAVRAGLMLPAADVPTKMSVAEATSLDAQCRAELSDDLLNRLASTLGVTPASLQQLGVGWHAGLGSYTFPMRDAQGRVIGLHTRTPRGEKRCVRGSKMGIVIAEKVSPNPVDGLVPGWLIVTEGVSDAAAALDLRFAAIARPGCESASEILVDYLKRHRPQRLVLAADADAPGQAGALKLARRIATDARLRVRILTLPGAKDLRAWKALASPSTQDLLAVLESPSQQTTRADVASGRVRRGYP